MSDEYGIFEITVKAQRKCRFCPPHKMHEIAPETTLVGNLESLAEVIPDAIDDEMQKLGWKDGCCKDCAFVYDAQLRREHAADDYVEDDQ